MTDAPQYTGWVERGATHGTVVGFIVDQFGWRIELTGTLNPVTRGYVLEGRLGPTPAALHIARIDGPRDIAGRRIGQAQRQPGPRAEEPAE